MNGSKSWWALALLGCLGQVNAGCHIHAPDDYPNFSTRPLVIPVSGDRTACETLNRDRFAGRGRCHCFDDSPLGAESPAESLFSDTPIEPERQLP